MKFSKANCQDIENPDIFFSPWVTDITEAKALCQDCPVKDLCLKYSQKAELEYGIFGGKLPEERIDFKNLNHYC